MVSKRQSDEDVTRDEDLKRDEGVKGKEAPQKEAPQSESDRASKANNRKSRGEDRRSQIEDEMHREAEQAVKTDIAAANSDVEAAAEEMGAREPQATPFDWPSLPPPRRSKADEAQAFFEFTRRFAEEFATDVAETRPDPSQPDAESGTEVQSEAGAELEAIEGCESESENPELVAATRRQLLAAAAGELPDEPQEPESKQNGARS